MGGERGNLKAMLYRDFYGGERTGRKRKKKKKKKNNYSGATWGKEKKKKRMKVSPDR